MPPESLVGLGRGRGGRPHLARSLGGTGGGGGVARLVCLCTSACVRGSSCVCARAFVCALPRSAGASEPTAGEASTTSKRPFKNTGVVANLLSPCGHGGAPAAAAGRESAVGPATPRGSPPRPYGRGLAPTESHRDSPLTAAVGRRMFSGCTLFFFKNIGKSTVFRS